MACAMMWWYGFSDSHFPYATSLQYNDNNDKNMFTHIVNYWAHLNVWKWEKDREEEIRISDNKGYAGRFFAVDNQMNRNESEWEMRQIWQRRNIYYINIQYVLCNVWYTDSHPCHAPLTPLDGFIQMMVVFYMVLAKLHQI